MTIYREETDELTTDRKEFRNKCCVWQRLQSDSYLIALKNTGSISTLPSENSHNLWAVRSLCWEGYMRDCIILKLRDKTGHYLNSKVFLSGHHSHRLMLIPLHSVHLGPHTFYSDSSSEWAGLTREKRGSSRTETGWRGRAEVPLPGVTSISLSGQLCAFGQGP